MEANNTQKRSANCLRNSLSVLFAILMLASCGRSPITKVENGNALRADCVRLLNDMPLGDIEPKQWPRSIQDLKPVRVVREENDIKIWTAQHTPQGSTGYYVFPNVQLSPPTKGIWIEKTEFQGIFIFKSY
jgi:hypothetical protein